MGLGIQLWDCGYTIVNLPPRSPSLIQYSHFENTYKKSHEPSKVSRSSERKTVHYYVTLLVVYVRSCTRKWSVTYMVVDLEPEGPKS